MESTCEEALLQDLLRESHGAGGKGARASSHVDMSCACMQSRVPLYGYP